MVKIIKEKNFDGRCTKCGCYFEYTNDDLENIYNDTGNKNSPIVGCYVKCPKCGEKVFNIWHNGHVKK